MAYAKHDEYFDHTLGQHVIHLKNEAGAEHIIQIQVGSVACPSCGHPHSPPETDIDVEAMIADTMKSLTESETRMEAHKKKYGLRTK